jgi:hypothetical protein
MDVLQSCCEVGCPLMHQISELFDNCAEVLRTPSTEPPYCTKNCGDIVSDILSTKYGQDLLRCANCAKLENVPKIKYLCREFQLNVRSKCPFPPTVSGTVQATTILPTDTEIPDEQRPATDSAQTIGVTTDAQGSGLPMFTTESTVQI